MKKSEHYNSKAAEAEGIYERMRYDGLALRETRWERFEDDWLARFQERFKVEKRENGSYSIDAGEHGVLDYYPRANKVLLRKKNKWIKPGLRWLVRNLLNGPVS